MSVGRFVDVESLAIAYLSQKLGPDVRVVSVLPADISGQDLIRVQRSPGTNAELRSLPRTDVECFSPDRARMWILAGRANNALAEISGDEVTFRTGPGEDDVESVQVDDVNTITDPVPAFWSPTVQRSVAVYEWDLRAF